MLTEMYDKNDVPINVAPHAQQIVKIPIEHEVYPYDLLRKANNS